MNLEVDVQLVQRAEKLQRSAIFFRGLDNGRLTNIFMQLQELNKVEDCCLNDNAHALQRQSH